MAAPEGDREVDLHLLGEGTHRQLWRVLGAHSRCHQGVDGISFAVWAPNARSVRVVGDFNDWDGRLHPMSLSYLELAEQLPGYLEDMGFTHIELMPLPSIGSPGPGVYQVSSYLAPTPRCGTPDDSVSSSTPCTETASG